MTRLADVREIDQAPPEGVRVALRPGDVAGLYAVHPPSLDGWGEGMEPFEALIVDVPRHGDYLGELTDGTPVEFSERNVAWLGPSMGGIFDWVRKAFRGIAPPVPGMPPVQPPPALPALPAPVPPAPPRPSFLRIFAPKPAAPAAPPEAARPSFLEWFRPRKPAPPPGPPALRPETPVAPAAQAPSMFAAFAPEAPGILRRVEESVKAIIPPERPGPLIPTPEIFKHIKPSPEEDFEAKKARQMQLWQSLFPEPKPGEDIPIAEMFKPFAPQEVEPESEVEAAPPVPSESLKILPLPARNTLMPPAMDVARGLLTWYHPIEQLWDFIREKRADPSFQKQVWEGLQGRGLGGRVQFESLGMCDGHPDVFQAVSALLHIPWSEVEARGQPVVETDEEGNEFTRLTDTSLIFEEIIFPATEMIHEAFELIKPPDLSQGHFSVEWGGHRGHS